MGLQELADKYKMPIKEKWYNLTVDEITIKADTEEQEDITPLPSPEKP